MKKIFLFILCFCTLISCFAVSAFADANEGFVTDGEIFIFKESLEPDLYVSLDGFNFTSDGIGYAEIRFFFENGLVGYYDETLVYDDGWVNDVYRSIRIDGSYVIPYDLKVFLSVNEQPNSLYDNVFGLVKDAIYGSRSLSENENFVLVLIATCFTVLVVALPLIVIFMIVKFFVGTIARY